MCRKIYIDVCVWEREGERGACHWGLRMLDSLSIFIMLNRKAFSPRPFGESRAGEGSHSRLIISSTLLFSSSPLNGYLLINVVSFFVVFVFVFFFSSHPLLLLRPIVALHCCCLWPRIISGRSRAAPFAVAHAWNTWQSRLLCNCSPAWNP